MNAAEQYAGGSSNDNTTLAPLSCIHIHTTRKYGSGSFWRRRFGDYYLATTVFGAGYIGAETFSRWAVLALGYFDASAETDKCV